QHHIERLSEDHQNAKLLAEGLASIGALRVDPAAVQTNMIFVEFPARSTDALRSYLRVRNIRIGAGNPVRLVTHLDVDAADMLRLIDAVAAFFADADLGAEIARAH